LPCIHKKIGTYKMCVDQGLPRAVMLLMFLLDPLVTHKPIDLLLICIRTCYIYLTFMFLYAKQVNEVWEVCKVPFLDARKGFPVIPSCKKLVIQSIVLVHNFRNETVGFNQIRTVFDPQCEMFISLSGYERNRRFYFNEDDV